MTINDFDESRKVEPKEPVEVKTPETLSPPLDLETNAVRDILGIEDKEMSKYSDDQFNGLN